MLFHYKNQPSAMNPMWSIYIMADRFLRNSGNRVEREVLLTFGFQFPSKRDFEKSKNTKVCLQLTLRRHHCDAFFL